MFAKALEANGATKVYIIGRRWDKLENVAKESVSPVAWRPVIVLTDHSSIPRNSNASFRCPGM